MQSHETNGMFLDRVRGQLLGMRVLVRHVGCPHRPTLATYSYTIGLTAYGHPELLLAGADIETAYPILMDLGRQVTDDGARFAPGDIIDGILEGGYPLAVAGPVVPDAADRYPITIAAALFTEAGPPLQILYPDDGYRFPWHAGYNMDEMRQPLLCPAPEPLPAVPW